MERRQFIHTVGAFTMLYPIDFFVPELKEKELLSTFIKQNEASVKHILEKQDLDKKHPFYGGFPDDFEIYHPILPAAYSSTLIAAYVSPSSKYYQSKAIKKCLNRGMDFLLKMQRPSGNIDLLTTNFESPPDTAFAVDPLAQALFILKKTKPSSLAGFQEKAKTFLLQAGEAMSIGGVHTPNHRWVITRALARLYQLFPKQQYVDRVNQWLGEGIDIDPDGQYTEKSSAGYSPMVDTCLITTARLLNKPELYAPVRKNLEMMFYFVHANGEVVTEASKRQDQYTIAKMAPYYFPYRYMANMDENPKYAAMVKQIEQSVGVANLAGNLPHFLELSNLNEPMPPAATLPANYEKHFPHSNMARIRRGAIDATILGNNYSFMTLFKGAAAIQGIRLASAFFGKGQFLSPSLKIENGVYKLHQELVGPYYQPHLKEAIAEDGNWEKMPRSNRPKSEIQYLYTDIHIEEKKGAFDIHFDIQGTDRVPLAIELAFRKGGLFDGVTPIEGIPNAFLLEKGFGHYSIGEDTIQFGPGHKMHAWTQLRGALPKLNGDSVYLTGYTPFKFTLSIS